MRTLVDITEQQVIDLKILSKSRHLSRAELIRSAISSYLEQHKPQEVNAFGLWKTENKQTQDGLVYQQNLRNEW